MMFSNIKGAWKVLREKPSPPTSQPRGMERIQKVVSSFSNEIDELTKGSEEVTTEMESNTARAEETMRSARALEARMNEQNEILGASKAMSENVKANLSAILGRSADDEPIQD